MDTTADVTVAGGTRRAREIGTWWGAGLAVASVGWGAQQFTPLLPLYQSILGLSATTLQGVFGSYVIGLIPGLLFGGPVSDRYGRRAVMVPTLAVSCLASVLLMLGGGTGVGWLLTGRLLAGIASGAAFSCGAAWIKELSSVSADGMNHGPRRLTVAMSIGFGVGPLVAGLVAQWLPAPLLAPYLPHLALAVVAFVLVLRTRDAGIRGSAPLLARLRIPEVRQRRFLGVVLPLAPWVFAAAAIALAYLPNLVVPRLHGYAIVFTAVVTMLCSGAGILVQPLARKVHRPNRLLGTALGIVLIGLLVAALAAAALSPVLVVVAALVLGAGYGACQVCGLLEVQRLAKPERLAGLTAVYQAASYVGFVVPYPMAAAGKALSPAVLLLILAGLAIVTIVVTRYHADSLRKVRR